MAGLKDNLEYFLARMGMNIASLLTPRMADSFGAFLGTLAYRIWTSRRKIATDNLKQALGGSLTDEEIETIVKKVFQNIGRTLVEFIRFRQTGLEGLRKIVVLNGTEFLHKAHEAGRGAVLVSAHFGNWEMLGNTPLLLGYDIEGIVAVQHNSKVDKMITQLRESMGLKVIPRRTSTLRDVLKALRANRFVGIIPDQHDPAEKLILKFFGRRVTVPRGPAAFAVKTKCPVIPFMLRRIKYDRHVMITGDPIYSPDCGDFEEDIRQISLAYLKFFEEIIRKYPEQWMWTHRRWKI